MKYRLKPEAVQFFKEKYATAICEADLWHSIGVDIKALEEVKDPFLSFGHSMDKDKSESKSKTLSGWDKEGSHFHFTVNFPSSKYKEHDVFTNGKATRELMNKIQRAIDIFYSEFNNQTI